MEPYEADVFSASFYIGEQYCVAHFGDLDEARVWLTTQQQAGVLRPHHVWQGNTVWLDEKDFRADAPQPDMAVCRRVESPALDAPDGPGWWGYTGEREGVVHFTEFNVEGDRVAIRWADDDYTMHYDWGWFKNFYRNIKFYRLHMPWGREG